MIKKNKGKIKGTTEAQKQAQIALVIAIIITLVWWFWLYDLLLGWFFGTTGKIVTTILVFVIVMGSAYGMGIKTKAYENIVNKK